MKHLIDNPKASATAAAKATYNVTTDLSARQQAHDNLTKPNVVLELAKYSSKAESVILEVMDYSKELGKTGNTAGAAYASVASANARDILDRVHGKATQRVEQHITSVTIGIDLTATTDTEN